MPDADLIIRNLSRAELDQAVEWAAQEGWNPGLYDADAFWAQDNHGFFGVEQDGSVVCTISAVSYGETYGFMGFFITRPELRNQGIGLALGLHGLERLSGRVVGQDGVPAMQDFYRRHGFELAFRSVRCQSRAGGAPSGQGTALAQVPFDEVLAYDMRRFPAPRPQFLNRWLSMPGATALGVVDGGALKGYGVVRPCRSGSKIGPLFADTPDIAEALYLDLRAAAAPGPVFLDVPLNNPHAEALARRHEMVRVFETGRMYHGGFPAWEDTAVFGITSFELG